MTLISVLFDVDLHIYQRAAIDHTHSTVPVETDQSSVSFARVKDEEEDDDNDEKRLHAECLWQTRQRSAR